MKRRNLSVLFAMIFCALLARAQDVPPPEIDDFSVESSDMGEADPLDVLETPAETTPEIPTVPEFTEIPEPGQEEEPPAPVELPPAPEIAPPAPKVVESQPSFPEGSNDPDYEREARFHRIYKKFNEQPTSEESWDKALAGRQAQTYQVQSGDTLWDISTTFFGDANYWPKIWSLNNDSILNPHQIDPKMMISFYPGSMSDAPTVGLAEATPQRDDVPVVEKLASGEEVTVPPRTKKIVPVLKNIPGSLPAGTVNGIAQKAPPIEVELPKSTFPQPVEYMSYYVSETPISGIGKVVETEMDVQSAMEYQYIFVELNDANPIGKRFMIQRSRGELKDPSNKNAKAYVIEVQGMIEVVARVNNSKPIYRAMVTKTLEHVEVGSEVVVGSLPMMTVQPGALTSGVNAKIIGGQFSNERSMFGANTLVFLNAGSAQGLQNGQTMQVYADQKVRNKKTSSVVNDRPIGRVKVVRVTPNFATAYVLNTDMDIVAGDYVGQSGSQARLDISTPSSSPAAEDELDLDFDDSPSPSTTPEAVPEGGSDDLELEL